MKLVVFGLAVSSSWGNGHASLWRGLIAALAADGHAVTFFERDRPFYAENRDLHRLPAGDLVIYDDWASVRHQAAAAIAAADVAIVTSFCADGIAAAALVRDGRALRCFYDLDTPVTLAALDHGEEVAYLGPDGLAGFDLVLSYTGGGALDLLKSRLGAGRVEPFYGWVDTQAYARVDPQPHYRADLSYLGTYADDRQATLQRLFIEPAQRRPQGRFVIGGAQYPADFPWSPNIFFKRHLPPAEHAAFYSSSRLTLNVTRAAMAHMGWCPSGRLFEAACCGTPIISDWWPGLDEFFEPDRDILVARSAAEVGAFMDRSDAELARLATRARDRVLGAHTAAHRARRLVALCEHAATVMA